MRSRCSTSSSTSGTTPRCCARRSGGSGRAARGWGAARAGVVLAERDRILSLPHVVATSFCTPWTAVSHDLAFSRLPGALRLLGCAAVAPVVWVAALFDDGRRGTETVAAWIKPPA